MKLVHVANPRRPRVLALLGVITVVSLHATARCGNILELLVL